MSPEFGIVEVFVMTAWGNCAIKALSTAYSPNYPLPCEVPIILSNLVKVSWARLVYSLLNSSYYICIFYNYP